MKAVRFGITAMVLLLSGAPQARSAEKQGTTTGSDKDRLVGAWHLASIASPGPNGTSTAAMTQPKGMLIYTRDGHMSVQLMYPESASERSKLSPSRST